MTEKLKFSIQQKIIKTKIKIVKLGSEISYVNI